MLLLLPPEFRRLIGFSTYEPDPYRLIGGPSPVIAVPKMIGTIPPAEGGRFQFREDEYQSGFYIFDFQSGRQSTTPSTSAYVEFVCSAVERGDGMTVKKLHELITALEAGSQPHLWDAVLPALFLNAAMEGPTQDEKWVSAAKALKQSAEKPVGARHALDMIFDKSRRVLTRLAPETAHNIIIVWRDLLKTSGQAGDGFAKREQEHFTTLVRTLLQASRYVLTTELLELTGPKETDIRMAVLVGGLSGKEPKERSVNVPPPKEDDEERKAFLALLDEGLHTLAKNEGSGVALADVLERGLASAQSVGILQRTWSQLSSWLLSEALKRIPADHAADVLDRIATVLQTGKEHTGCLNFRLWQLENLTPRNQDYQRVILRDIAVSCACVADQPNTVQQTLSRTAAVFRDRTDLFLEFLGVLFQQVESKAGPEVIAYYRSLVDTNPDLELRWKLHRHISKVPGGQAILASCCANALFPWSQESSTAALKAFILNVVGADGLLADLLAKKICALALAQATPYSPRACLSTCLRVFADATPSGNNSLNILGEALVEVTALDTFQECFSPSILAKLDTRRWKASAASFVKIARYYASARHHGIRGQPDIMQLATKHPDLAKTIASLSDNHWDDVVTSIIGNLL